MDKSVYQGLSDLFVEIWRLDPPLSSGQTPVCVMISAINSGPTLLLTNVWRLNLYCIGSSKRVRRKCFAVVRPAGYWS